MDFGISRLLPILGATFLVAVLQPTISVQLAFASHREKNTVDPAEKNYTEGLKRIKEYKLDGAIDSFLQAIYFSRNGYNPLAWFWLAECYSWRLEDAKAIEAFNKHLEQVTGPSPEAHIELGYVYMRDNRDDSAASEFNQALAEYMGPGPRAHNALGKLAEKEGRYGDAVMHYRDALGDQPWSYTEAWLNMAECYVKMQNWSEAIGQYKNIMKGEKINLNLDQKQKILLNLGLSLLAKGDHQGAIEYWKQCLDLNPMNATAHLNLAMVFDQESHITSAINEYKSFVRCAPLDPKSTQVQDRITMLEQQLKPQVPELRPAQPTPYMRQAAQEAEAEKRKEFENLKPPTVPKESPF